jgi:uncharacterized membrane protein YccC
LSFRKLDHAIVAGVRAAVAIGVPVMIGVLLRRPDLAALAPYGAFTATYGRGQPYRQRAVSMAVAGLGLILAMSLGWLLGAAGVNHWLAAAVIAVGALLATLVMDAVRTGPPGGFIIVLAMLVSSVMPMNWSLLPVAIAITIGTALFGWCVVMSGWLVWPLGPVRITVARALEAVARYAEAPAGQAGALHRHQAAAAVEHAWQTVDAEPGADRLAPLAARAEAVLVLACHHDSKPDRVAELSALAAEVRRFVPIPVVNSTTSERTEVLGRGQSARSRSRWSRALRPDSPEFLRATRSGVGVLLAYWAALALGLGHAYWAGLAAAGALQAINVATAVQRAIHRSSGSVLGAFVAAAVLWAHLPVGGLAAVATAAMFVIELVIASNYAIALVFITTLISVLQSMAEPVAMVPLLVDRVVATAFGAVIGVLCGVLLVNTRYADLLAEAIERCAQAKRELTLHWAKGETAQLPQARIRLRGNLLALRDTLDLAIGEPSDVDLRTEQVLDVERAGYQALIHTASAPLTR